MPVSTAVGVLLTYVVGSISENNEGVVDSRKNGVNH